jgi:hypothetical protein
MPSPRIPAREPLGDLFVGVVLIADERHLLALTPIEGYETIHQGTFIVRYGVVYTDDEATQALAKVDALIAETSEHLPERLLDYIQVFPSMEA